MHSYVNNMHLISVPLVMLCTTLDLRYTLREVLFSPHFKPNVLVLSDVPYADASNFTAIPESAAEDTVQSTKSM